MIISSLVGINRTEFCLFMQKDENSPNHNCMVEINYPYDREDIQRKLRDMISHLLDKVFPVSELDELNKDKESLERQLASVKEQIAELQSKNDKR